MAATVDELRWAAEHGFVSVGVPGSPSDPDLPPLYDPYYEPFWAACEELDLVLSVHAGWGASQGSMQKVVDEQRDILSASHQMELQKAVLSLDLGPRRVFWLLVLGGVFDRHPNLRLSLTEIRADWVPATLAHLDRRFASERLPGALRPSEYFRRNCAVTPSSIHRSEVERRHDIGVDNLLFGVDYPHYESIWPNTLDWMRAAFAGVPEAEVRAIVGENAIRWYRLDRAPLAAVAERIGPRPDDILGREVAPDLLANFDRRAGFSRHAEVVDVDALDAVLNTDISTALV